MANPSEYVARGESGIVRLLTERASCVWHEIEALLAEQVGAAATRIDPHHLTTAKGNLLSVGTITQDISATRGGRTITTLQLGSPHHTQHEVAAASARKRLLYARYLGWASGTDTKQGIIGPALEHAVLQALKEAAPYHGYRLENPDHGAAAAVGPVSLAPDFGPLDNAFHYIEHDTGRTFALPLEAKNVRDWIYPTSDELYQLLSKAAYVSTAWTTVGVVPVFVCRRGHITLFRMALDLGFYVIQTLVQPIRAQGTGDPEIEAKITEVRSELSFNLRSDPEPPTLLRNQFRLHLPRQIPDIASRWSSVGSRLGAHYEALGHPSFGSVRKSLMQDLRDEAVALGAAGGW